jgi:hypothetical protein
MLFSSQNEKAKSEAPNCGNDFHQVAITILFVSRVLLFVLIQKLSHFFSMFNTSSLNTISVLFFLFPSVRKSRSCFDLLLFRSILQLSSSFDSIQFDFKYLIIFSGEHSLKR